MEVTKDKVSLFVGKKIFSFDHVFEEDTQQEDIYLRYVQPLVESLFSGYNGTVLAYGQTGSGKTYSIMGLPLGYEDEGVIPRALRSTFDLMKENKENNDVVSMQISFLEIYNDEVKDLLHPDIPSRDIIIREDKEGRIFFTGAREVTVSDVDSALYYLERGNLGRTTAETCMNSSSSRSHAIFTISMEIFKYNDPKDQENEYRDGSLIQSKLHLVDLAGSERAKRTQAVGIRLKESVGINQGLLALGKVIRALTSGSQQHVHVPYRESKLTRFLQDSLGGNSRTFMLACVSAAEINLHETLSTLQYAARTRSVQNKVVANVQVEVSHIDIESNVVINLRSQLNQMQEEIELLRRNHRHDQVPGADGDAASENDLSSTSNSQLKSAVRVVAEAQWLLALAFDRLGHPPQPKDCGIAWDLVCNCKKVVEILGYIIKTYGGGRDDQTLIVGARTSLRRSLVDTILGSAAQVEEVESLQKQLKECREDLKRDEEIFTEKVRDLKRARKEIQQLKAQNNELQEKLSSIRLSRDLVGVGNGGADHKDTKTIDGGGHSADEKPYPYSRSKLSTHAEGKVGESKGHGHEQPTPFDELDLDKVDSMINSMITARVNRELLIEVKQKYAITLKEREELRAELRDLKAGFNSQKNGNPDGGWAISKQAADIEKRIEEINEQLSQHMDDSRAVDRLQRTKRNYEEYVEELLRKGAFFSTSIANSSSNDASRIEELREELKVLDTEIELCESRLEELREDEDDTKDAKLEGYGGSNNDSNEPLENVKAFVDCLLGGGRSPSMLRRLLVYLTTQLVDSKFKSNKDVGFVEMLQVDLNNKQAEMEELIASSNKARGDSMKRLEQHRAESDEKIAFLLQQLKNTEAKLLENSKAPSSGVLSNSSSNSNSNSVNIDNNKKNNDDPVDTMSMEAMRGEVARLERASKDAVRKWENEKSRRISLEDSNAELTREMKLLRGRLRDRDEEGSKTNTNTNTILEN